MLRKYVTPRALLFSAAALALATLPVATLAGRGDASHSTAATRRMAADTAPLTSLPGLARYREGSPHVTSRLSVYGVRGAVQGARATPPDELAPVSASAFRAPIATYLRYSMERLALMQSKLKALSAALTVGDRAAAQVAWRQAYAYYLNLGAVYLEGPVSDLNDAIDGTPGGLAGGVASPGFSGLHRLERGLWTGAHLATLEPWARKLASDVAKLAKLLPHVQIEPVDFATRAHEILEDAVRDQLSGLDARWSGAGVLGTDAAVAATARVIQTLAPLLRGREGVLATVNADLHALQRSIGAIRRAHAGALPTTAQLTQRQSEQLEGSIGQALESLAQVPGALETTTTPVVPAIPAKDARIAR